MDRAPRCRYCGASLLVKEVEDDLTTCYNCYVQVKGTRHPAHEPDYAPVPGDTFRGPDNAIMIYDEIAGWTSKDQE